MKLVENIHVKFVHEPTKPHARGVGVTTAILFGDPRLPSDSNHAFAYCSSHDQYSKVTGRKIAFARVLQETNISRPIRKLLWEELKKKVKVA